MEPPTRHSSPYSVYCARSPKGTLRYYHKSRARETTARGRTQSLPPITSSIFDSAAGQSSPPYRQPNAPRLREPEKETTDDNFWVRTGARPKQNHRQNLQQPDPSKKDRRNKCATRPDRNQKHNRKYPPRDEVQQKRGAGKPTSSPLTETLKHSTTSQRPKCEQKKNQPSHKRPENKILINEYRCNPHSVGVPTLDNTGTSLIIARERSASVGHSNLHEGNLAQPPRQLQYTHGYPSPVRSQLPLLEQLDTLAVLQESRERLRHLAQQTDRPHASRSCAYIPVKSKGTLHTQREFSSHEFSYRIPSVPPAFQSIPSFANNTRTYSDLPPARLQTPYSRYRRPSNDKQRYRTEHSTIRRRPSTSSYLSSQYLTRSLGDDLNLSHQYHQYSRYRRPFSHERFTELRPRSSHCLSSEYLAQRRSEDINLAGPSTLPSHYPLRYWRTSSEERHTLQPSSTVRFTSSEHLTRRLSEDRYALPPPSADQLQYLEYLARRLSLERYTIQPSITDQIQSLEYLAIRLSGERHTQQTPTTDPFTSPEYLARRRSEEYYTLQSSSTDRSTSSEHLTRRLSGNRYTVESRSTNRFSSSGNLARRLSGDRHTSQPTSVNRFSSSEYPAPRLSGEHYTLQPSSTDQLSSLESLARILSGEDCTLESPSTDRFSSSEYPARRLSADRYTIQSTSADHFPSSEYPARRLSEEHYTLQSSSTDQFSFSEYPARRLSEQHYTLQSYSTERFSSLEYPARRLSDGSYPIPSSSTDWFPSLEYPARRLSEGSYTIPPSSTDRLQSSELTQPKYPDDGSGDGQQ